MTLEVIERHVYQVTDRQVARQLRQALAAGDVERLDELITYLDIDGPGETGVLTVAEMATTTERRRQATADSSAVTVTFEYKSLTVTLPPWAATMLFRPRRTPLERERFDELVNDLHEAEGWRPEIASMHADTSVLIVPEVNR